MDRLIGRLTPQVPECDVHRRERAHFGPRAPATEIAIERAPVCLHLKRILPQQIWGNRLMYVRFDWSGPHERLAEPDQSLVGLDSHPDEVSVFSQPDRLYGCDDHVDALGPQ
jgi:hypothetical protein